HAKLFARDEGASFFAAAATTEDTRGLDCTKSPLMAEHERLPFRKRRCRLEAAPPARDPSGARKSMVLQEVFESEQRLEGCPPRRPDTSQAAAALPRDQVIVTRTAGSERADLPRRRCRRPC